MTEWKQFNYFSTYNNVFNVDECQQIIDMQTIGQQVHSVLGNMNNPTRDSNLFWLHRNSGNDWVFDRLKMYVDLWNANYNYEIDGGINALQLTTYKPGQYYHWHTDIGANQASKRKITIVVQLNDVTEYTGGGTSFYFSTDKIVTPTLSQGDMLVFHSFMQHQANEILSGQRWTLVGWYLGLNHLR